MSSHEQTVWTCPSNRHILYTCFLFSHPVANRGPRIPFGCHRSVLSFNQKQSLAFFVCLSFTALTRLKGPGWLSRSSSQILGTLSDCFLMTGLRLNIFWQDYHIDDVGFSREILKMEKKYSLNDVNDSVDQGQCWGGAEVEQGRRSWCLWICWTEVGGWLCHGVPECRMNEWIDTSIWENSTSIYNFLKNKNCQKNRNREELTQLNPNPGCWAS